MSLLRGLLAVVLCALPGAAQPFLYVTNQASNSISVINTRDNRVTATFPTPFAPASIAITPDGARGLVANASSNSLLVVNLATNQALINLGLGQQNPMAVAVSPNGQRIYVANTVSGTVAVLNATNLALLAFVRAGNSPVSLAVTPDNNWVYVANASDSTVTVINASNNTVFETIEGIAAGPAGIAVAPNGSVAYVASPGSGKLTRIDLRTNEVNGVLDVERAPVHIAFSPDSNTAYLSSNGTAAVTVVDVRANRVAGSIALPDCLSPLCNSFGIVVSADGRQAYVADATSDLVHVINTADRTVSASVRVEGGPRGIALAPAPRPAAPGTEEGDRQ